MICSTKILLAALALCSASLMPTALVLAATPPDACSIVSKSDAAKALGAPIVATEPRLRGPSSTCAIRATGAFRSISITAYRWSSIPEAETQFQSILATTAHVIQPSIVLHGLGDQAQQIGSFVYVRKGTAAYVFNMTDGLRGMQVGRTIALAKNAIKHAP